MQRFHGEVPQVTLETFIPRTTPAGILEMLGCKLDLRLNETTETWLVFCSCFLLDPGLVEIRTIPHSYERHEGSRPLYLLMYFCQERNASQC